MQSDHEPADTKHAHGHGPERNLEACAKPDRWSNWFDEAEASMQSQWNDPIWPLIRRADFSTTLEIAPGAGRNSARLAEHARTLHLVDLNRYALDRCRERFHGHARPVRDPRSPKRRAEPGIPPRRIGVARVLVGLDGALRALGRRALRRGVRTCHTTRRMGIRPPLELRDGQRRPRHRARTAPAQQSDGGALRRVLQGERSRTDALPELRLGRCAEHRLHLALFQVARGPTLRELANARDAERQLGAVDAHARATAAPAEELAVSDALDPRA
jgi:hypothetical protein